MQYKADIQEGMLTAIFPGNYSIEFRRYPNSVKRGSRDHDLIDISWSETSEDDSGATVNKNHSVTMTRHEFETVKSLVEQTDNLPTDTLTEFKQ